MIVCYAHGGGLGHLTRIRAYLHTRGLTEEPVTILTGSPFAGDPRVLSGHRVRSAPAGLGRDDLTRWVRAALTALRPRELVVDAFPAGLSGELSAAAVPPGTRVVHLARLLRWDAYRPLLPPEPLRFDRTWLVEPVGGAHRAYLDAVSSVVAPLALDDPPEPRPAVPVEPGGWLIVHSGPADELIQLVAYAQDIAAIEGARPYLTLVSPSRPDALPPEVAHRDVYPAWPLFAEADRIITAAGCNAVRQLARWRERHRMLPFPRRFDDQYARAARARGTAP
ncbi:hypothetical protein GCM10029978_023350 [Actinoallomurus acanthiterrae]